MNNKRYLSLFIASVVTLSLALAACGSEPADTAENQIPPMAAPLVETELVTVQAAPTSLLETQTPEPEVEAAVQVQASAVPDLSDVTVTFWHIWGSGARGDAMHAIVDEFNAANEWGITVEAIDMGFYPTIEDEFYLAIQSGEFPDAVLGYANALSSWYSVGAIADINIYVDDPQVGFNEAEMADFYEQALVGALTNDGPRLGLPISQSVYVLFYNTAWAKELGFEQPPQTAQELRAQACRAFQANSDDANPDNDGTGGLVLYPGASYIMPWIYAFGEDGLAEDGTAYDFTSAAVNDVAQFWKTLWDEGCAFPTEGYPNPEFATRQALFVMSSSAGLPHQAAAFEEAGSSDAWTVIPFPGREGQNAVNTASQYVAIAEKSPEQKLAAWLFLKYFASPEVQAQWVRAGDYYPVRRSAEDLLKTYVAENPQWAAGLELMNSGQTEPNMASWGAVRRAVEDAFEAILQGSLDQIPALLEELDNTAAELKAEIEG